MADLVRVNYDLQTMTCTECKAHIEVPRRVLGDPDGLLDSKQRFAEQHQKCQDKVIARAKLKMWGKPGPQARMQ